MQVVKNVFEPIDHHYHARSSLMRSSNPLIEYSCTSLIKTSKIMFKPVKATNIKTFYTILLKTLRTYSMDFICTDVEIVFFCNITHSDCPNKHTRHALNTCQDLKWHVAKKRQRLTSGCYSCVGSAAHYLHCIRRQNLKVTKINNDFKNKRHS